MTSNMIRSVELYYPILKQHKCYFGTDTVILNRGEMTMTTPEFADPSTNIPITSANPILHIVVGRLSPRWSTTGLTPFLDRPGQCDYFCTTPA
ncbi:hypothetical protein AVEN_271522-1 [Araneus ventricosus]|uniref:Uncharacterized protein n=1 Tax=Araneus ventricosus TaxID=182803 RepID=A0A4Y2G3X5_ARAVE|nr:hypothetical protein AVEN_271522-1 [Araneus ventricosus]